MPLQPFEFRALEVCLDSVCRFLDHEVDTLKGVAIPALNELSLTVSTLKLKQVRSIKSRLVAISGRVQKVHDELEQLLDDDEDMDKMYLTDKKVQEAQAQAQERPGGHAGGGNPAAGSPSESASSPGSSGTPSPPRGNTGLGDSVAQQQQGQEGQGQKQGWQPGLARAHAPQRTQAQARVRQPLQATDTTATALSSLGPAAPSLGAPVSGPSAGGAREEIKGEGALLSMGQDEARAPPPLTASSLAPQLGLRSSVRAIAGAGQGPGEQQVQGGGEVGVSFRTSGPGKGESLGLRQRKGRGQPGEAERGVMGGKGEIQAADDMDGRGSESPGSSESNLGGGLDEEEEEEGEEGEEDEEQEGRGSLKQQQPGLRSAVKGGPAGLPLRGAPRESLGTPGGMGAWTRMLIAQQAAASDMVLPSPLVAAVGFSPRASRGQFVSPRASSRKHNHHHGSTRGAAGHPGALGGLGSAGTVGGEDAGPSGGELERTLSRSSRSSRSRGGKKSHSSSSSSSGSSSSTGSSSKKWDVEELEMLLEAYFVQVEGTLNKLSELRAYVDDTEDMINITLDEKQNSLLQMNVVLTNATVFISMFIVVTGVFGMNIPFDNFVSQDDTSVFYFIVSICSAASVFLFIMSMIYMWKKKLIVFYK